MRLSDCIAILVLIACGTVGGYLVVDHFESPRPKPRLTTPEVVAKCQKATIALRCLPRDKGRWCGAGFLVNDHQAVTCAHLFELVAKDSQVEALLWDNSRMACKILHQDKRLDLAILELDTGRKLDYLNLTRDQEPIGELAVCFGSPWGRTHSVSAGVISAYGRFFTFQYPCRTEEVGPLLQLDSPLNPGNSGGAVVGPHGTVIGVAAMIQGTPGGGIGFAIPAEQIHFYLLCRGIVHYRA